MNDAGATGELEGLLAVRVVVDRSGITRRRGIMSPVEASVPIARAGPGRAAVVARSPSREPAAAGTPTGQPRHPAIDRLLRQVIQEAGWETRHGGARPEPARDVSDVKVVHGSRQPHVEQPTLLLELLDRLGRAAERQQPLFGASYEHDRELHPLRVVEGHEGDRSLLRIVLVDVTEERGVLEEEAEIASSRLLLDAPAIRRERDHARDELVDVGQPILAVLLRLESTSESERAQALLGHLGGGGHRHEVGQGAQVPREQGEGASGTTRQTFHLAGSSSDIQETAVRPGPSRLHTLERHRSDTAAGPPDRPKEGGVIRRIHQQLQIGQDVLDLPTLVEPDAADYAVRHPDSAERVLVRPRLGIRAVEDAHLPQRVAVPVGLDLTDGPGGLRPLIPESRNHDSRTL